jgi:hypothetical protein
MVTTKWIDAKLNIGMVEWNEVWLLTNPYPTILITEIYRSALVFRVPKTSKCIGYL